MRPARTPSIRLSAPRACFCSGPRPGHELCPCRERNQSHEEVRILLLEDEVRRLRSQLAVKRAGKVLIRTGL